jgi:hypothetical protein
MNCFRVFPLVLILALSGCGGGISTPTLSSESPNNTNSEVPRINFLDGTLEGSVQINSIEACDFYFEMQIENGTGKKMGFNFFQEEGEDWLFRLNADGLNPKGASIISVTKPNGGIEPGRIGKILFKIMLFPEWVDEYNSVSILFKGKTIYETAVSLPNCD